MTFDDIKTEICDFVGITAAGDIVRVGRAINRRYREITSSLGIKHTSRRTTTQATVTLGVSTVAFTATEKVVNVFNRATTPYVQLKEVTVDELEARMPFATTDFPTEYAIKQIASDSVTILFDSIPQTAFTLYADVYSTAATLSGTDEPAFSESYHDILVSAVLVDELLKIEKAALSAIKDKHVEKRMGELRHWIAVSTTKKDYVGKSTGASGGASSGGSSDGTFNGALSWTQTGLVTFDRGASAPYAVVSGATVVTNLDADKLDGLHSSSFVKLDLPSSGTVAITGNTTIVGTVGITGNSTVTGTLGVTSTLGSGAITSTGSVTESSRAAAMGYWTNEAYSDAHFLGDGLDANWVVGAGDFMLNRWMLVGKTLIWSVTVSTTTVANTPAELQVRLPNGYIAATTEQRFAVAYANDGGVIAPAYASPSAVDGHYLRILKTSGVVWNNSTNGNAISFTVQIEIT